MRETPPTASCSSCRAPRRSREGCWSVPELEPRGLLIGATRGDGPLELQVTGEDGSYRLEGLAPTVDLGEQRVVRSYELCWEKGPGHVGWSFSFDPGAGGTFEASGLLPARSRWSGASWTKAGAERETSRPGASDSSRASSQRSPIVRIDPAALAAGSLEGARRRGGDRSRQERGLVERDDEQEHMRGEAARATEPGRRAPRSSRQPLPRLHPAPPSRTAFPDPLATGAGITSTRSVSNVWQSVSVGWSKRGSRFGLLVSPTRAIQWKWFHERAGP